MIGLDHRSTITRYRPLGSDLSGVDAELPHHFSQRLVACDDGQRHLSLHLGLMILSRALDCLAPLVSHLLVVWVKPGYYLPFTMLSKSLEPPPE